MSLTQSDLDLDDIAGLISIPSSLSSTKKFKSRDEDNIINALSNAQMKIKQKSTEQFSRIVHTLKL